MKCRGNHLICFNGCFGKYISSTCREHFNFRQSKRRIKCPVPDCHAEPWSIAEIRQVLYNDPTALDLYVETLLQIGDADEEKVGTIAKIELQGMIVEAVNIRCPNTVCQAGFSSKMAAVL